MTQSTATVGHSGHSSQGPIIGIVAVLAAFVIVAFVAMLVTRSGSSSAVSATNQTQAPAVAQSVQQVKTSGQSQTSGDSFTRLSNSVRIGDLAIRVDSVQALSIAAPEPSMKYVIVEISVQNAASSYAEGFGIADFRLIDSDGQGAKIPGASTEEDRLGDIGKRYQGSFGAKVQPGATTQVVLVFKILKDTKPARLEYSQNGTSGVIPLK